MQSREIVNMMINDVEDSIKYLCGPNNNDETDDIKTEIKKLSDNDKIILIKNLENIIKYILLNEQIEGFIDNINLSDENRFNLIENAIYYIGRIGIKPDVELLKKVYNQTENYFIKQNITFTVLPYYVEDIELDFVNKLLNDSIFEKRLCSWTIAFFYNKSNPYEYEDNGIDDCEIAKKARINRLTLNNEDDLNIEKAKAFRLLDLIVIYLFQKTRGKNFLTDTEKEIISNVRIDYDEYSEQKKKLMLDVKK
ncbi:MAG: hypothetical protein HFJ43_03045 [Clostridia bacterium]|nr:hypothetical protein [Clostridia bacterium]